MKMLVVLILLIGTNLISGLSLVYSEHQGRRLFTQLQELRQQQEDLELGWRLLQLEQSTLAAQSVIDHKARTRLGMFVPPANEVVYIKR
jgi:cell division protein FtsL